MKNRIYGFVLSLFLIFLAGCGKESFFDVQSTMQSPKLSSNHQALSDAIAKHMGANFIWKYPDFAGKHSPIINLDFKNHEENLTLAFCSAADEPHKIHMLVLKSQSDDLTVLKDDAFIASDIIRIYFQDINNDTENEIVLLIKNFKDNTVSARGYKFDGNEIVGTLVPASFLNKIEL